MEYTVTEIEKMRQIDADIILANIDSARFWANSKFYDKVVIK